MSQFKWYHLCFIEQSFIIHTTQHHILQRTAESHFIAKDEENAAIVISQQSIIR